MSATAATTVPAGVGSAIGVGAAVDGGTREVVAAVVDSALEDVRSGADGDGALEELLGDAVDRLLDVAAEVVADEVVDPVADDDAEAPEVDALGTADVVPPDVAEPQPTHAASRAGPPAVSSTRRLTRRGSGGSMGMR
jgi:hypothetical protein